MAEVKAKLKYLRIAPRKMRAVSALIEGMDYAAAKELLRHTPRKAARPLIKLLDSAATNGRHNFDFVKENLYVKNVTVDEGVKLKRARPKGFGLAARIEKKTSHINLILDERVKGLRQKEEKKAGESKGEEVKIQAEKHMPEVKRELGREGIFGSLRKKMFRRKAI